MRKIIILCYLLFFALCNGFSQPNPGFENWTQEFSYESPDSWQTLNFLSFFGNPISATKVSGIDKHSGNYAMKLKTIYVSNNPKPGLIDDTMGVIFTGLINLSPLSYTYGFPYTQRPEKLTFWYKYIPVGADQGGVKVTLTKWNGTQTTTVAIGQDSILAQPNYSMFELNLDYMTEDTPDSVLILVGSSKHNSVARVGSVLYLDDFALTGQVGIKELESAKQEVYKVFPNPAKDNISFLVNNKEVESVEIKDILGKRICTFNISANTQQTISTSFLTQGTYFYTFMDKTRLPLSTGRFDVIH